MGKIIYEIDLKDDIDTKNIGKSMKCSKGQCGYGNCEGCQFSEFEEGSMLDLYDVYCHILNDYVAYDILADFESENEYSNSDEKIQDKIKCPVKNINIFIKED